MATFSLITEGAAATPETFNSRFSSLATSITSLEAIVDPSASHLTVSTASFSTVTISNALNVPTLTGLNELSASTLTSTAHLSAVDIAISSQLTAAEVNISSGLTASGGGSLTGTWTDLGAVTTVDINGGTIDDVTLAGTISGTPTWASTQVVNITGNASGTAATVTTAAQPNITTVGTLSNLTVDNININANTIKSIAGTDLLIDPLAGQQVVIDGGATFDAGVVTGITSLTATNVVGTVTIADQPNITGLGSLTDLTCLGALETDELQVNSGATVSGNVVFETAVTSNGPNGFNFAPVGDVDVDLLSVDVTGNPKLSWDELFNRFRSNVDLEVDGALTADSAVISGDIAIADGSLVGFQGGNSVGFKSNDTVSALGIGTGTADFMQGLQVYHLGLSAATIADVVCAGMGLNANVSLASNTTEGLLYIPTVDQHPIGTPQHTSGSSVGYVALVFNRTDNTVCVYDPDSTSWISTGVLS